MVRIVVFVAALVKQLAFTSPWIMSPSYKQQLSLLLSSTAWIVWATSCHMLVVAQTLG